MDPCSLDTSQCWRRARVPPLPNQPCDQPAGVTSPRAMGVCTAQGWGAVRQQVAGPSAVWADGLLGARLRVGLGSLKVPDEGMQENSVMSWLVSLSTLSSGGHSLNGPTVCHRHAGLDPQRGLGLQGAMPGLSGRPGESQPQARRLVTGRVGHPRTGATDTSPLSCMSKAIGDTKEKGAA